MRLGRMVMGRIAWVDDQDATGLLAELYSTPHEASPTGQVPAINRTMSQRPDFLAAIMDSARTHYGEVPGAVIH